MDSRTASADLPKVTRQRLRQIRQSSASNKTGQPLNKNLGRILQKALDEGKQLFWIVVYFWVLIGVFSVFRSLVLNESNLIYHEGFALVTAFVLAKVVLTAELFGVADKLKRKPLVYPITFKSAVFCVILMCFYIAEETIVGIWRGKTIIDAFPDIGGGGWKGIFVVGAILFVGLMPFFAYRELARVLGRDELYSLVFKRGSVATATPSRQRRSPDTNGDALESSG